MKGLLITIFLAGTFNLISQSQRIQFLHYLENIENKTGHITLEFDSLTQNVDWMYQDLQSHMNRNKLKWKRKYLMIFKRIVLVSDELDWRMNLVHLMLDGCLSSDYITKDYCISNLSAIPRNWFDTKAKNKVRELLRKDNIVNEEIIRLVGYLGLKSERKYLSQAFIADEVPEKKQTTYTRKEWAALNTLARLGDKKAFNKVMEEIQIKRTQQQYYIHPLSFIKTKESIEAMIDLLLSDERLLNEYEMNIPGALVALKVLPLLAKSVKNYPHPIKRAYHEKDLKLARDWFSSRPKIKINKKVY